MRSVCFRGLCGGLGGCGWEAGTRLAKSTGAEQVHMRGEPWWLGGLKPFVTGSFAYFHPGSTAAKWCFWEIGYAQAVPTYSGDTSLGNARTEPARVFPWLMGSGACWPPATSRRAGIHLAKPHQNCPGYRTPFPKASAKRSRYGQAMSLT